MTRKDYIAIAQALADGYRYAEKDSDEEIHYGFFGTIVSHIAKTLKEDNPAFNKDTFIDYIEDRI